MHLWEFNAPENLPLSPVVRCRCTPTEKLIFYSRKQKIRALFTIRAVSFRRTVNFGHKYFLLLAWPDSCRLGLKNYTRGRKPMKTHGHWKALILKTDFNGSWTFLNITLVPVFFLKHSHVWWRAATDSFLLSASEQDLWEKKIQHLFLPCKNNNRVSTVEMSKFWASRP